MAYECTIVENQLRLRVESLEGKLRTSNGRLVATQIELRTAQRDVEKLRKDAVSGLLCRTAFQEHLEGMFARRRADDLPVSIIMCDIDHFKRVNDAHGHLVGDQVLAQVAATIQLQTRTSDIVARYGGEEFVVVAVKLSVAGLALLCDRIRRSVAKLNIIGLPQVTISIGFSSQEEGDETGWEIVDRADKAMYRAKENGRNQVNGDGLGQEEVTMIAEIDRMPRPRAAEDVICEVADSASKLFLSLEEGKAH